MKAADEKQLAKTILIYVDALRIAAQTTNNRNREYRMKWKEQCQMGMSLDNWRAYLKRVQERLYDGQKTLLSLAISLDDLVQKIDKDGHQTQHLKDGLSNFKPLLAEIPTWDKDNDTLELAGDRAFQPNPISESHQFQAASLTDLRRNIAEDIAPGYIRDKMVAHLANFEKLARAVEGRDELFFPRWLTETRDSKRRKNELDERETGLGNRQKQLVEFDAGIRAREAAVQMRESAVNGAQANSSWDCGIL